MKTYTVAITYETVMLTVEADSEHEARKIGRDLSRDFMHEGGPEIEMMNVEEGDGYDEET